MIELRADHWITEVPDNATDFGFINDSLVCKLPDSKPGHYHWLHETEEHMHKMGGEWEIVCTSKEATEEQAVNLIQWSEWYFPVKHTRYIDYTRPYDTALKQKWSDGFGTALESFSSLLASKGCDVNKNWLIIKKQK
jgi:hypothetical protein